MPEEGSCDYTRSLWIQFENKYPVTETERLLYQLSGKKGRGEENVAQEGKGKMQDIRGNKTGNVCVT